MFDPKRMSPERLQEGLEWSWSQSYSWRSILHRLTGAPWSILPLWLSTDFGYRFFAEKLPSKADGVYREPFERAASPSSLPVELAAHS